MRKTLILYLLIKVCFSKTECVVCNFFVSGEMKNTAKTKCTAKAVLLAILYVECRFLMDFLMNIFSSFYNESSKQIFIKIVCTNSQGAIMEKNFKLQLSQLNAVLLKSSQFGHYCRQLFSQAVPKPFTERKYDYPRCIQS